MKHEHNWQISFKETKKGQTKKTWLRCDIIDCPMGGWKAEEGSIKSPSEMEDTWSGNPSHGNFGVPNK